MALRTILKQPGKMPSGTQVKQDALAITVGRRGILSRIVLRQLRRPWLHVQSAKITLEKRLASEV